MTYKNKKTLVVEGVEFELKNKKLKFSEVYGYNYDTLYKCYEKPSQKKQDIYNEWSLFFLYLNKEKKITYYNMGINSYNSNIFTFNALIEYQKTTYYIDITPIHNYIYEVLGGC